MPIRVLHVIDHLGFGGAPMVVKNIAEGLDPSRVETFVCPLRANPRELPIKANMIHLGYGKYDPRVIPAIKKVCRERHIDIIHAHLGKAVICSLIAGPSCGAKVVIHEHGPIFTPGTSWVLCRFLHLLGHRATLAIANSQATVTALHEKAGMPLDAIHIIDNFVDFARFDPALYDRQKAQASLNLSEDDIVVGFVGRLDPAKGADILIEAGQVLININRRYRLVIVGEGRERPNLERLASQLFLGDRIVFAGLCENPAQAMAAFDLAVVPSRQEAFGIAVVEFMRMRIPVIASAAGGLIELVRDGETGLVLNSLDPQSIVTAVLRLMGDPSLRQTLADNAAVFSQRFDGRRQLQQLTQLYEQVCPRRTQES
jgi:glycosyltransferase involved in cell wall biosynthesis